MDNIKQSKYATTTVATRALARSALWFRFRIAPTLMSATVRLGVNGKMGALQHADPCRKRCHLAARGIAVLTGIFVILGMPLFSASQPDWWTTRGILSARNPSTNDYAVANLGQLKWFGEQAKSEFDVRLSGGTSSAISNIVASFVTNDMANFAAANVGQLKAVATPFYDCLRAHNWPCILPSGMSTNQRYPWTLSTNVFNDFAILNVGQLKYAFSFDLNIDWPPTANDDTFAGRQSTIMSVAAPGVLANDYGFGCTNLTAHLLSGITGLSLSSNGAFTYMPPVNWVGSTSFTYCASNSQTNSNTAVVTLIISVPNQLPTITLTSPANGTIVSAHGSVLIQATATDADGAIACVQFFANASLLGETAAPPYEFNWTCVPPGTHTLTARAMDNEGATGVTQTILLDVIGTTNLLRDLDYDGMEDSEEAVWLYTQQTSATGLATIPAFPNVLSATGISYQEPFESAFACVASSYICGTRAYNLPQVSIAGDRAFIGPDWISRDNKEYIHVFAKDEANTNGVRQTWRELDKSKWIPLQNSVDGGFYPGDGYSMAARQYRRDNVWDLHVFLGQPTAQVSRGGIEAYYLRDYQNTTAPWSSVHLTPGGTATNLYLGRSLAVARRHGFMQSWDPGYFYAGGSHAGGYRGWPDVGDASEGCCSGRVCRFQFRTLTNGIISLSDTPTVPPGTPSYSYYGQALAVATNGASCLVSAPRADERDLENGMGGYYGHGSVGLLTAPDADLADYGNCFGLSISMFGGWLAVGAPYARVNGVACGAVYVYARASSGWVLQAKLAPRNQEEYARFGSKVCVDGTTLMAAYGGGGQVDWFRLTDGEWKYAASYGDGFLGIGTGCMDFEGDTLATYGNAEGRIHTLDGTLPGLLHGQRGWLAADHRHAVVQTNVVRSGAQALEIRPWTNCVRVAHQFGATSNNAARQSIGAAEVWIDYWTRPVLREPDEIPAPEPLMQHAVHFDRQGLPIIATGSGGADAAIAWTTLTHAAPVSPDDWQRVTVQLKSTSAQPADQRWALWVNGCCVATNQPMLSNMATNDRVILCLDGAKRGTTYIDDLVVARDSLVDTDGFSFARQTISGSVVYINALNTNAFIGLTRVFANSTGCPVVDGSSSNVATLSGVGAFVATNLALPLNWLVAYCDSNTNGVWDESELWGCRWIDGYTNQNVDLQYADTDSDGLPDWWEIRFGLNPNDASDAAESLNFNGLSNLNAFYQFGANFQLLSAPINSAPSSMDSDGDGIPDYAEWLFFHTSSTNLDADADGIRDGDELFIHGTSPLLADTDGGGAPDGWEVTLGINPLDPADDRSPSTSSFFAVSGSSGLLATNVVNSNWNYAQEYQSSMDIDGDGLVDFPAVATHVVPLANYRSFWLPTTCNFAFADPSLNGYCQNESSNETTHVDSSSTVDTDGDEFSDAMEHYSNGRIFEADDISAFTNNAAVLAVSVTQPVIGKWGVHMWTPDNVVFTTQANSSSNGLGYACVPRSAAATNIWFTLAYTNPAQRGSPYKVDFRLATNGGPFNWVLNPAVSSPVSSNYPTASNALVRWGFVQPVFAMPTTPLVINCNTTNGFTNTTAVAITLSPTNSPNGYLTLNAENTAGGTGNIKLYTSSACTTEITPLPYTWAWSNATPTTVYVRGTTASLSNNDVVLVGTYSNALLSAVITNRIPVTVVDAAVLWAHKYALANNNSSDGTAQVCVRVAPTNAPVVLSFAGASFNTTNPAQATPIGNGCFVVAVSNQPTSNWYPIQLLGATVTNPPAAFVQVNYFPSYIYSGLSAQIFGDVCPNAYASAYFYPTQLNGIGTNILNVYTLSLTNAGTSYYQQWNFGPQITDTFGAITNNSVLNNYQASWKLPLDMGIGGPGTWRQITAYSPL